MLIGEGKEWERVREREGGMEGERERERDLHKQTSGSLSNAEVFL